MDAPHSNKSPRRHFFYTPSSSTVRNLTGFTKAQKKQQEETIIFDNMENHEPYRDDEEEERGGGGLGGGGEAEEIRLKPMSVSTGDDYETSSATSGENAILQRKACFAAILSVCFLIFGYWLTIGRENNSSFSHNNNNNHQFYHSSSSGGGMMISQCAKNGYDTNYFTLLVEKVQGWNQTQQCTTELSFKIHDCKCHNPFLPRQQNQHPGGPKMWFNIVQQNIDLIRHNYTDRGIQPEVVIFGDSITEHLIGRNYGKYSPQYSKHAEITTKLLTKRGHGHINGLPLGIAADHMAHLLYRLQNGELPEVLTPKVWWLLIGTNDIGFGCSIETIVAGHIRLVKEIRERHNNQHGHKTLTPVVINSIMPRGKFELHSNQSPYARIIRKINEQLDCYAQLTEGIYFVNVTDTMTETFPTNGTYLRDGYFMGDNLHPTPIGTRQWEETIVSQVMQYMT